MLTTRVADAAAICWVGGHSIRREPVAVKRIIGVVTQFNTLDRRLAAARTSTTTGTLLRQVAQGVCPRRPTASSRWSPRLTDRRNRMSRPAPAACSAGSWMDRALAHHPATSSSSTSRLSHRPGRAASLLWEILEELHQQGQTILLTTHYMDEADQLCQRLAIMDHGKILALGSPDELKQTVGAATLVGLEASPVTDALVAALKAIPGVRDAERTPRGVQLYADGAGGILPKVVQAVMDAGADLRDLSVSEPTLETVFIKLTGRELRE